MTPSRLLALDLDGTLLTSRHEITERSRRALSAAARAGWRVVLVSARPPRSVADIAGRIGLREPYVALNGGLVVDERGGILHSTVMRADDLHAVLRGSRARGLVANLFGGFDWYAERQDDLVAAEAHILGFGPTVGPLPEAALGGVSKSLVMGPPEAVREFGEELRHGEWALHVTFSKPEYLEISPAGVTKAVGLARLCEHLDVPPARVIAVGDNYNDLEMLAFAGTAIAVYNAPDAVRAHADRVIPANDDDGVARFVEELIENRDRGTK